MSGIVLARQRFPPQLAPSPAVLASNNPLLSGFVEGWLAADGAGAKWASLTGRYPLTFHGSGPLWKPGPLGNAALFDGSTNYADSSSIAGIGTLCGSTSHFSVSVWVMTTTPSTRQAVLADWNSSGQQQSLTIEIGGFGQTAGHITTNLNAGGAGGIYLDSGVGMTAGLWYHVVVTWGATTLTIYVNGIYKNSSGPWSDPGGGTKLALGRGGAFTSLYLAGGMTFPLFWGRALAADEIQQLYVQPFALVRPPSTLRWEASPVGSVTSKARSFAVIIG